MLYNVNIIIYKKERTYAWQVFGWQISKVDPMGIQGCTSSCLAHSFLQPSEAKTIFTPKILDYLMDTFMYLNSVHQFPSNLLNLLKGKNSQS